MTTQSMLSDKINKGHPRDEFKWHIDIDVLSLKCSSWQKKLFNFDTCDSFLQQLQSMLLSPLQEMSNVSFSDIRYKQLECVLQVRMCFNRRPLFFLYSRVLTLRQGRQAR